ncbi:hypothetical protein J2Z32_003415 [Paenibacillus turicensis]|uniref:Uncharacterized protein n=1 Tax=Paenibacillus turicensis TaxID=160487 RepID=A0ABS4FVZ1_9BACL|nr:hypothetical protein [Paenibacillus turicensis]
MLLYNYCLFEEGTFERYSGNLEAETEFLRNKEKLYILLYGGFKSNECRNTY